MADHVLHALVVAVGGQVVVRLQLPGKAVHEGVVQHVAPKLFGREAVVGVLLGAAEGLAPVGHVRRLELAQDGVGGVLRVAGLGAEEQEDLHDVLLLVAASQGTEEHGDAWPLAGGDDPVVPIEVCTRLPLPRGIQSSPPSSRIW